MGAGAQRVNELFDSLFAVGTATEDGTGGKGHVEGVPGDTPPCQHGALPGFSSGVASGDPVAIMRRRGEAVSLGSLLKPTGEQVGDRTIWTPTGLKLRLRGKVLDVLNAAGVAVATVDTEAGTVTLAGGTKLVVLHGDSVVPDTAFFAHTHSGVTTGPGTSGPATPGVPTIGTCSASASKTKAG